MNVYLERALPDVLCLGDGAGGVCWGRRGLGGRKQINWSYRMIRWIGNAEYGDMTCLVLFIFREELILGVV